MLQTFSSNNFHELCDELAAIDTDLAYIVKTYGYPPLWSRANTYETLVHIILEQQVSLASAKAALEKLRLRVQTITPENVMLLTDQEFKAAYFSRQKTGYVKYLSEQLIHGHLDLHALELLPDEAVRARLVQLKGIGNWTVDIYLIMVLHRIDVFPLGDLAVITALRQLKELPKDTPREKLLDVIFTWQPYRTIATMLLWHYYLSQRPANNPGKQTV
jgi:DNA-3-methyladenine glycosylase II